MPVTTKLQVLRTFARERTLNPDDWTNLYKGRFDMVREHLHDLSMPELGECTFLRSDGSTFGHELAGDQPQVTGHDGFSLKTQGLYGWDGATSHEHAEGTGQLLGLTRKGEILFAEVVFKTGFNQIVSEHSEWQKALRVEVQKAELAEMVPKLRHPEKIWLDLGRKIHKMAKRRLELYQQAQQMADRVNEEEDAFRAYEANMKL